MSFPKPSLKSTFEVVKEQIVSILWCKQVPRKFSIF